jgi:hypothetical protein
MGPSGQLARRASTIPCAWSMAAIYASTGRVGYPGLTHVISDLKAALER